jgi:cation diffusion facilitator CzcD-associated flavoprotein CzcO
MNTRPIGTMPGTTLAPGDRVCVIGAGSSGIAACQVLDARGIAFDCFEAGSQVGGNWRYMNDNGMSSAYRSLHINTSRDLMAYRTLPMPADYPDYPGHFAIARYFDAYVDNFGLREKITFRTEVTGVVAAPSGGYHVTVRRRDGEETRTIHYGAVLVASGHHWDPRLPEPAYQGAETFTGVQIHAHAYKTPDLFVGKRVLVLGMGNSATDIAVESSRNADATFLAMRRGAYVLPKYIFGRPTDETNAPFLTRMPLAVQRLALAALLRISQGRMTDYGLPQPDHKLLEAHPTISSDLLLRIGHGDIGVRPNIESFDGDRVRFIDGREEQIDVIVYCTGYKVTFPFFDESFVAAPDNQIPLYRRVVDPEHVGLYFIGLLQPLGAIMPLAEAQSEWVADVLEGKVELPSRAGMLSVIRRENGRMAKRYVASKRHTIQVDFHPYLRTIARERRAGAMRSQPLLGTLARGSHELRLGGARP